MGQLLYLECQAGISGDMMAAALLDLGADRSVLQKALDSLPVDGFQVEIGHVKKAGLDCCDFLVKLDSEHENHDHDMEYLHGHSENSHHDQEHYHKEYQNESHNHNHEGHHNHNHEGHHKHDHMHRNLPEILAIINAADVTDGARDLAVKIFKILAAAEAKAHGVPEEQVHFHEVGALDSIVDIITVAVCLDNLGIKQVIIPGICEGQGTVRCQHGVLPIPVPAVVNIIEANGLPVSIMPVQGEFITPTGAAIAAAIMTGNHLPEQFQIVKTGLGAGKRTYERPSILRAMLIQELPEKEEKNTIIKLETNLDDCSGEALSYVMERLFEAGARDVFYTPIYMKKNRPAWLLTVICTEDHAAIMDQIIFEETTTIGIRHQKMERTILPREIVTIHTPYGKAQVKKCNAGQQAEFYPEYESIAKLARENHMSYRKMYQAVKAVVSQK